MPAMFIDPRTGQPLPAHNGPQRPQNRHQPTKPPDAALPTCGLCSKPQRAHGTWPLCDDCCEGLDRFGHDPALLQRAADFMFAAGAETEDEARALDHWSHPNGMERSMRARLSRHSDHLRVLDQDQIAMRREVSGLADALEATIAKVRELNDQMAKRQSIPTDHKHPHGHRFELAIDDDGLWSAVSTGTNWYDPPLPPVKE